VDSLVYLRLLWYTHRDGYYGVRWSWISRWPARRQEHRDKCMSFITNWKTLGSWGGESRSLRFPGVSLVCGLIQRSQEEQKGWCGE